MPPRKKNPKKPTAGKKPAKKKPRKILKLIPLAPKSEDRAWINRQLDKLNKAEKALVITVKDGIVYTGWAECSREDIVFLCQSVVHDLFMDNYLSE